MWLPLVLAVFGPSTAWATEFDPRLTWNTLSTEHFRITYHDREAPLAAEMAVAAEEAWAKLTPEIGTTPPLPVELVLVDWTDSANGYATVVPRNTIVIFVTAPGEDSTLGLYEDWSSAIVTHELTHILHIDTVEGLPLVVRWILGSIISTHQISPGWVVEGYATYQETRFTTAGRGRHAGVDMIKRAAVLDGQFPPLGNMDGFQSLPPSGNLRYLFGQDFIQFIADSVGPEAWTRWVQVYGRSVPFLLPTRAVFGKTFQQMHGEWRAALTDRYARQLAPVEAEGVVEPTPITPPDEQCGSPAWRPDGGRLAYSCTHPRTGSATYLAKSDGTDRAELIDGVSARALSWRADGKALVYARSHTVDLYNTFDDIYLRDLAAKKTRALTSGARARDPAFSPDGSRLYVVTNGAQETQLQVLTVDGQLRPLAVEGDHVQYGTPKPSPDGRLLAVSVWKAGLRDLWLYTAEGTPWRRLTMDAAIDRDPSWSEDGGTLYFTSDRSGIPNIYAVDVSTGRLWRVTNTRTGVWGAVERPGGGALAMVRFETRGPRVALLDIDRHLWRDLGLIPLFPGEPDGALDGTGAADPGLVAAPAARTSTADASVELGGARRYNPLRTLFPPRYWLPGTYLTNTGDSVGLYAMAQTAGEDTLEHLRYTAFVSYRTDAQFLGGGGSFTVNRWRPVVSVSASTSVSPYGDIRLSAPVPDGGGAMLPGTTSARTRYWDRRVRGYAGVGYPLDERSALSLAWSGTVREPLDPLPADAAPEALPTRGFFSSVAGGYRWSKGTSYALSISPEAARSFAVGAELTSSIFGSRQYDTSGALVPFDQLQATTEWREYWSVPRTPNHVLAWKLSGGGTVGDRFQYGSFRLGGDFSESGITVVPSEWRMLRGYYPASDAGEWYWLASVEYRLPLWHIDRGVGTIPAFLQDISLAGFVDSGNAFDDVDEAAFTNTLVGAGVELRVTGIVSYGLGLTGRLGYAFGATQDGKPFGAPEGLYAVLGSSF